MRHYLRLIPSCFVLIPILALAQSPVIEMRDLRISCLEAIDTAETRLSDLSGFVQEQERRHEAVGRRVVTLSQTLTEARHQARNLGQSQSNQMATLEQVRGTLDRVTTSYKKATEVLPTGEAWAADGAAALSELQRAAWTNSASIWLRDRSQSLESELKESIARWRSAKRQFQQVGFDLQLRGTPEILKRIESQFGSIGRDVQGLTQVIGKQEGELATLRKSDDQWNEALRDLQKQGQAARVRQMQAAYSFHLVDLKFAAWRLAQPADETGMAFVLPDVREESINGPIATDYESLPRSASHDSMGISPQSTSEGGGAPPQIPQEQIDESLRELVKRITLAKARLDLLSGLWEGEYQQVRELISKLNRSEDSARDLEYQTGRLAADLEASRRSAASQREELAAGLQTLEPLQKRFSADLNQVKSLTDNVVARTSDLDKKLKGLKEAKP
ncbi:MAG: hypothetical protein JWM68_207 [Verrucomicrobiales bacterium]|nr:hypothetical protein [Verrucomicrobiales bacterium]